MRRTRQGLRKRVVTSEDSTKVEANPDHLPCKCRSICFCFQFPHCWLQNKQTPNQCKVPTALVGLVIIFTNCGSSEEQRGSLSARLERARRRGSIEPLLIKTGWGGRVGKRKGERFSKGRGEAKIADARGQSGILLQLSFWAIRCK